MSGELRTTREAVGMEWPGLRNQILCMAHVTHVALGAFMSTLGAKASPSLGNPMSGISNLERMKAQTLGKDKDFKKRAMRDSTRCRPLDQV